MLHRFIEAQDEHYCNYGRFFILRFQRHEIRAKAALTGTPLFEAIPAVQRFGGRITPSTLLLLDLATQEGLLFDPEQNAEEIRRRFLVHPIHVCILFYPFMRFLAQERARIWSLPTLVTLSLDDVLNQPGVLLDSQGQQVRTRLEWSRRPPLVARLRNREVLGDPEAGQDTLDDEGAGSAG